MMVDDNLNYDVEEVDENDDEDNGELYDVPVPFRF